MELVDLKKQIQTKALHDFYVFAGEETGIMKEYLKKMSKVLNRPIEYLDTVQGAFERTSRAGLVSNPKLIVVQDDKSFLKAENMWARVGKGLRRDTLVLLFSKIDKRSKFFKEMDYVAFNPMPPQVLAQYIMKASHMNEQNSTKLAEICLCSYNRAMQECDKINSYLSYRESIADATTPDMAFRLLLNNGTIYQPIGDITFDIVEAIMNRNDVKRIEKMLMQARSIKEPRLLSLSLLYSNFRVQLMYQSLVDKSTAEQTAGLNKREIKTASYRDGKYSLPEVVRALQIIQSLEFGIKAGTVPEDIALDYLVAQIV